MAGGRSREAAAIGRAPGRARRAGREAAAREVL